MIQERVQELGRQITQDYQGRQLVLLGVLNGAFIFAADLCRAIDLDLTIDFISVTSYGKSTVSSGTIRLLKEPSIDLDGKDVLLVEDIIDSGHTIAAVLQMLETRQPKTLKVCALLDKPERREANVPVNYLGFTIPNKFVFGYGLDLDEYYRNLPFVGVVDLDKYKPSS